MHNAPSASRAELRGHPLDASIIAAIPDMFARAFRSQGLSHYTPEQIEAALMSAAGGIGAYDLFRTGTGLVAMLDGSPVACGALGSADIFDAHGTPAERTPPSNAEVQHVATVRAFCTDPDFAGRGLGRLIMDGLFDLARTRGVRELRLTATLSAVGFYERCGFIAGQPFAIPGGDGMRIMAMPMQMSLPDAKGQHGQSDTCGTSPPGPNGPGRKGP